MSKKKELDSLLKKIIALHVSYLTQNDNPLFENLFDRHRIVLESILKYISLNESRFESEQAQQNYLKDNFIYFRPDNILGRGKFGCASYINFFLDVLLPDIQIKSNVFFNVNSEMLNTIKRSGDNTIHNSTDITNDEIEIINNDYEEFVAHFFGGYLNRFNWYKDLVEPELKKINPVSDHSIKITKKESSIIKLDNIFWENICAENNNREEELYKNFLLGFQDKYTKHFIEYESNCENTMIFEQLNENYSFYLNDNERINYENSIINLLLTLEKSQSLLKIFAPTGNGKTVLLYKIAKWLSKKNMNVYEIKKWESGTGNELIYIINTVNNPYFLIDRPSSFEEGKLNEIKSILEAIVFKNFVFIIADRESVYNSSTLYSVYSKECFNSSFAQIVTIDFMPSHILLEDIYNSIIAKFNFVDNPQLKERFLDVESNHNIRERISTFSNQPVNAIFNFNNDWNIFDSLIQTNSKNEFRDLYKIIGSFTQYDDLKDGIEIDFVHKKYFKSLDKYVLNEFIIESCEDILIVDENKKVRLRTETHSKLFKDSNSLIKSFYEDAIREFIEFNNVNYDDIECRIIRNLSRPVNKIYNFKDKLELYFANYIKSNLHNSFKNEMVGKCYSELIYLNEGDSTKQLELAEEMYKVDVEKIQPKTKLSSLYLKEFVKSKNIKFKNKSEYYLDLAVKQDPFNAYVIDQEVKSYEKTGRKITFFESLIKSPELITDEVASILINKLSSINTINDIDFRYKLYSTIKDLSAFKNNIRLLNKYIDFLVSVGQFKEAYSAFNKNREIIKEDIYYFLQYYEVLFELKMYEEAEKHLIDCIAKSPEYPALYILQIKLYRTLLRHNPEKLKFEEYKSIIISNIKILDSLNTINPSLNTEKAIFLFEFINTKKGHEKAIELLQFNIRNYELKDSLHSYTQLALIYQKSQSVGDINKAVEILTELETKFPFHEQNNNKKRDLVPSKVVMAESLILKNDVESLQKAILILEEVEKVDVNNIATYFALIKAYNKIESLEGIDRICSIVLSSKLDFGGNFYNNLSETLLINEQYSKSILLLEIVIKKDKYKNNIQLITQLVKILLKEYSYDNTLVLNILKAEKHALYAFSLNKINTYIINLLINIYDKKIVGQEDRFVQQRNHFLSEFIKIDPSNLYLLQFLYFIYQDRPRMILRFMEKNINFSSLKSDEKLVFKRIEILIYTKMNCPIKIESIKNELINLLSENLNLSNNNKYKALMTKINDFNPRPHVCVSEEHIWCIGVYEKINNVHYVTQKSFNRHRSLETSYKYNNRTIVYFSKGTSPNIVNAFRLEHFFSKRNINEELLKNLPGKLGLISY